MRELKKNENTDQLKFVPMDAFDHHHHQNNQSNNNPSNIWIRGPSYHPGTTTDDWLVVVFREVVTGSRDEGLIKDALPGPVTSRPICPDGSGTREYPMDNTRSSRLRRDALSDAHQVNPTFLLNFPSAAQ